MKNGTIVFAPATFNLAETSRMVEIAKELRSDFDCQFFGYSVKFSKLITDNNFQFQLCTPVLSEKEIEQIMALDQMKGIKNPFNKQMVEMRVRNELELLTKLKPKMILTGTNLTIFLSARIAKIPLTYVKPYALSVPYYIEKMKNKGHWIDFLITRVKWIPRSFKEVANQYKLQLPQRTLELLEGDYNMITTSELFYDAKSLPANYFPVGPIYAKLDEQLSTEILDFISTAKKKQKKLIYFAAGSSGNRNFVKNILHVLTKQNFYVIAPVNIYFTVDDKKEYNNNILCCDWLPAHLVSRAVDFSVIHGGEGTVQTACDSGKPFIGFGLQMEQKINLSYCENYGNAIQLKKSQVNSKIFKKAMKDIQSQQYLQKAEELEKSIEGSGTKKASNLIKQLIRGV